MATSSVLHLEAGYIKNLGLSCRRMLDLISAFLLLLEQMKYLTSVGALKFQAQIVSAHDQ